MTRFARLRERLEEAYTRRAQAYGVEPTTGMDRIAFTIGLGVMSGALDVTEPG